MNNTEITELFASFSNPLQPLAQALCAVVLGGDGETLVNVLSNYQNDDGGFGHGLEADIQMPMSSVATTNLAMNLLEDVRHPTKRVMMERAVAYYESVYDRTTLSFPMVPDDVDRYPHAVWWNHDTLDAFTYGNPNPEVLGTLLVHRSLVSSIDLQALEAKVVAYIETEMSDHLSMHSLLSAARLYRRASRTLQDRLHPTLLDFVGREIVADPNHWSDYGLEPYQLARIAPALLSHHQALLTRNLEHLAARLQQGPLVPAWQWYQDEDVFDQIKEDWSVLLTYEATMALQQQKR